MKNKYLLVNTKVLPDVFEKVMEVKDLINLKKARDISEAVKIVGISRSTYYKYKDCVFPVSETTKSTKVAIYLLLGHKTGTLSRILDKMAENHANILTINQDIPINNAANVSITFDIYNLKIKLEQLLEDIKNTENVIKADLIAME
ncbi:ACT domain-containing protein [Clostridium pasteurianum]|uniref:ACT domain-containing protein n=1 Tax=Clostridium pasteurianum TaxID=1501 RepID=UPI002260B269|nr:ACT domain-containing protein [Clostridium pasteurianum]UZW15662.1 ACT domain-containing protein [Clostridium pasteurianum]